MLIRLKDTGKYPAEVQLISIIAEKEDLSQRGKRTTHTVGESLYAKMGVCFDTGQQTGDQKWPTIGQSVIETPRRKLLAEVLDDIEALVEQVPE